MGTINLTGASGFNASIDGGNPTGNKVFTLPTASGTVVTTVNNTAPNAAGNVTLTTGKVLQVVSTLFAAQGSTTITTADTSTIPAITHTITPLGTGSKFLINVRWFGETIDADSVVAHICRNSARINEANTLNYHGLSMSTQTYGAGNNNDSTPDILTLTTLDTTGSTAGTAITYELKFSGPGSNTVWTNRCFGAPQNGYETGISEIIITEIGA